VACRLSTSFFNFQIISEALLENFKSKLTQEFLEWIGYYPRFSTRNHPAVCGFVVYQDFPLDLRKNVTDYLKNALKLLNLLQQNTQKRNKHGTPNSTIFVIMTSRST